MNTNNYDLPPLPPDPNERRCKRCNKSLGENVHGNRNYHSQCYYEEKKERQKKNYMIGNAVKLIIQKNDAVSAILWKMDPMKNGFLKDQVMEYGIKFNCHTLKVESEKLQKTIYIFDQYGYAMQQSNDGILIIFYHVSEL